MSIKVAILNDGTQLLADIKEVTDGESKSFLVINPFEVVYQSEMTLAEDNDSLRAVFDDYIKPWGTIKRGDDILVSLSMSHFYKNKHKTISTEVTLLPEKDVGLNTYTNHEELRWKVVEDFQNLHSFQNN